MAKSKAPAVATLRAKFLCTFVGSTFNDTKDHVGTVVETKCVTVAQFLPVMGDGPFEQQEGHEMVVSNGGRLSLQVTALVDPVVPGKPRPAVHADHEGMFDEGVEYILSIERA